MYDEVKMEKLTINLPPIDLGRIDILVEAGHYPNRTEFVRSAIRTTLASYQKFIDSKIEIDIEDLEEEKRDSKYSLNVFGVGAISLGKKNLEKALAEGKKVKIHVIGLLYVKKEVAAELIEKTVEVAKVYGVLRASPEVKRAFEKIKRENDF
ncbi:MAG: hypothetical protein FK731_14955 [Asgard group archaeon]|nr:hypothetical protein [Asgard group archaeon]